MLIKYKPKPFFSLIIKMSKGIGDNISDIPKRNGNNLFIDDLTRKLPALAGDESFLTVRLE